MDITTFKDYIEFFVLIVGIPFAIVQLFLLVKQVKTSALQTKNQTVWDRKNATFIYINKYVEGLKDIDKGLSKKIGLVGQQTEKNGQIEWQAILENDKKRQDIMNIVFFFENLAIGINEGYFDKNIAEISLKKMAITTYKVLIPYFKIRKEELGIQIATTFRDLVAEWEKNTPANTQ
jgi:hypothetical protein